MQKKIIALAVAGLMSGAAFAQSNVTIYGNVDVGYRATDTDTAAGAADKTSGIDDSNWSSSRIGFKGEEALGNGLKAIFQLEYSLNNDENASIGNARTSIVGLSGNFGTVVAGRANSPGKNVHDKYDVMGGSNMFSASQTLYGGITTGAGSSMNERLSNAVAYMSPTFGGGFNVVAAYSFAGTKVGGDKDSNPYGGNTVQTDDPERVIGLSAEYAAGPFGIAYAYHNISEAGNTTTGAVNNSNRDIKEHLIAGSYDFGVVKLFASYLDTTHEDNRVSANSDVETDTWSIGAAIPLGGGNLRLSYADVDGGDTTIAFAPSATSLDTDAWSIAYTYDMSKRTTLYAGYTAVSNDNAQTVKVFGTTAAAVGGADSDGYAIGINHKF